MTAARKLAELDVTIPIRTVSETNQREHWASRHRRRREQRQTVALVVGAHLRVVGLEVPCIVTLTRIAPRSLDGDNLQGALKAVRDGVADALGVDDSDPRISWGYAQRRGAKKQHAVHVRIVRSA